MTPLRSIPVLLLLLSVLTVISGCARKKPVMVVIPKEQPPATAPTPAPTPAAKTEPQKQEPSAQAPEQPQPTPEEAAKASPEKAQKKARRQHGVIRKPSPVVKAEAAPPEVKPEPRSTPAPISPAIPPRDAARDQSSTEQLLQTTENNLNGIKRQLSKDEEVRVAQIRGYISQSRQATKDNDPARAYNLAFKANLLCNELVQPR